MPQSRRHSVTAHAAVRHAHTEGGRSGVLKTRVTCQTSSTCHVEVEMAELELPKVVLRGPADGEAITLPMGGLQAHIMRKAARTETGGHWALGEAWQDPHFDNPFGGRRCGRGGRIPRLAPAVSRRQQGGDWWRRGRPGREQVGWHRSPRRRGRWCVRCRWTTRTRPR